MNTINSLAGEMWIPLLCTHLPPRFFLVILLFCFTYVTKNLFSPPADPPSSPLKINTFPPPHRSLLTSTPTQHHAALCAFFCGQDSNIFNRAVSDFIITRGRHNAISPLSTYILRITNRCVRLLCWVTRSEPVIE